MFLERCSDQLGNMLAVFEHGSYNTMLCPKEKVDDRSRSAAMREREGEGRNNNNAI